MKILELYAEEFGCLVERRFSFADGLVIIEGENESGKSTLQALFRFLFYGFPRRAGVDAEERDKYLSHKGRRASGSIRFLHGEEEYLLRRQVILRGSAKRELVSEELSTVRLPDGVTIELGNRSPGEYFLGMPWELYQSSFCARQTELASVSAPETSGALGDFLFRGDESARIDKAQDALTRARRELQYQRGRGGKIAELEDEAASVKQSITDASACAVALHEKRDAMTRYAKLEADLSHDVAELKKKIKAAEADEMLARFDAWHAAKKEEDAARRSLDAANADRDDEALVDEAFLAAAHEDIDVCERTRGLYSLQESELAHVERSLASLPEQAEARTIDEAGGTVGVRTKLAELDNRTRIFRVCGAVLAAVALALIVVAKLLTPVLFVAVALFVGLSIGVFVSARGVRQKKNAFLSSLGVTKEPALQIVLDRYERGKEAKTALLRELDDRQSSVNGAQNECLNAEDALLSRIEAAGLPRPAAYADAKRMVAELEAKRRNGMSLNAEKQHTLERAITKRQAYENGLDVATESEWRALRATLPVAEKSRAELARELEFKRSAHESAANAYTNAKTDVAVMTASMIDPAVLREREREITAELETARLRYAAVTLAEEALLEAGRQMRESVIPRVAKTASLIFAGMVGEKDRSLLLENDFSVKVMTPGGVYPLSHFSVGCRDAALLAMRLALSEAVSEEPLPLLFDEVTAHLDDVRATRFLHTLCDYCAAGRQGVLFTCHKREAALLADNAYHRILL